LINKKTLGPPVSLSGRLNSSRRWRRARVTAVRPLPPPCAGAVDKLTTSAPRATHAAATSSCVPRLYPLCSCHAGVEFLFVSSQLASALLLPDELAVTSLFPTPRRRPNWGTRPAPFPPHVGLRSSSHCGPPAPELAHHRPLPPLLHRPL
jgi:hypothetical protein